MYETLWEELNYKVSCKANTCSDGCRASSLGRSLQDYKKEDFMKRTIVFFSRTGISKTIALEIGSKLKSSVVELKDSMKWSGFLGFMRGGFYASTDKAVDITFDETCLDSDEFILLSPLWAGGPAPAARAFIRRVGDKKVRLILTNDGSRIENAVKKINLMFPSIRQTYGITRNLHNKDQVINDLLSELSSS